MRRSSPRTNQSPIPITVNRERIDGGKEEKKASGRRREEEQMEFGTKQAALGSCCRRRRADGVRFTCSAISRRPDDAASCLDRTPNKQE